MSLQMTINSILFLAPSSKRRSFNLFSIALLLSGLILFSLKCCSISLCFHPLESSSIRVSSYSVNSKDVFRIEFKISCGRTVSPEKTFLMVFFKSLPSFLPLLTKPLMFCTLKRSSIILGFFSIEKAIIFKFGWIFFDFFD